jgi:hypothetical protein
MNPKDFSCISDYSESDQQQKEIIANLALNISISHARAQSPYLQQRQSLTRTVAKQKENGKSSDSTYHTDDHGDMRRNKHVGYGRYGHATSNRRTGNVEHEESIMIGQSRKHICKDCARDESKQSIDLQQVLESWKVHIVGKSEYHNSTSGRSGGHESIKRGKRKPHHDASND